jgi:hypothetical protein
VSLSEEKGFGLEQSKVTVEKFPLIVAPVSKLKLNRIYTDEEGKTTDYQLSNSVHRLLSFLITLDKTI